MLSVRNSVVAGKFYPDSSVALKELLDTLYIRVESHINKKLRPESIIGGIVPHAGYVYSGEEAIHFVHFLRNCKEKFDTFVIINPSHHGNGEEIVIDDHKAWKTPLGEVDLDEDLRGFMNIPKSIDAQRYEHSAEVILPFLQHFLDYEFKILPVCMKKQSYKNAKKLAEAIFKANQVVGRKLAIIASSDFSHYVRPEVGFYNDNLVINRIINNSIRGLYDTIVENSISVCGFGPIMALMFYARMVKSEYKVEILARGNSGRQTKEDLVVDYVSALFHA